MKKLIALLFVLCLASGCTTAQQHRAAVLDDSADKISIAAVQRELKVGMSSAEVVEVLGAPNMVTTDKQRRETWVYDKVSYLQVHSETSANAEAGVSAVTRHRNWGGQAGLSGGGSVKSGANSVSERTLTVVVKFDAKGQVRDFAYRQTSF